jgi:membrane protein
MATSLEHRSIWEFGGLTPLRLVLRSWKSAKQDDIWGRSAQLSYYFLLAVFPALLCIISVLGIMAGPGSALRESLMQYLARALPPESSTLISHTLDEVVKNSGAGKMSIGILGALWAASGGMSAISDTLNIAYHVTEKRSWLKRHASDVGLTIALSVLIIAALAVVLFGGKISGFLAAHIGLGKLFTWAWAIGQWLIVLGCLLFAFALTYYFAPDLYDPEWHWITPGAVIGFTIWLASTAAMRIYLAFFNNYSNTYGSLGAVIILMLWFYLTGASILIGGEVNSTIKHAEVEEEKMRKALRKSRELLKAA